MQDSLAEVERDDTAPRPAAAAAFAQQLREPQRPLAHRSRSGHPAVEAHTATGAAVWILFRKGP